MNKRSEELLKVIIQILTKKRWVFDNMTRTAKKGDIVITFYQNAIITEKPGITCIAHYNITNWYSQFWEDLNELQN